MAHYNDFWNLYVHIPKGQNMKRDWALGEGDKFADWGGSKRAGGDMSHPAYTIKRGPAVKSSILHCKKLYSYFFPQIVSTTTHMNYSVIFERGRSKEHCWMATWPAVTMNCLKKNIFE